MPHPERKLSFASLRKMRPVVIAATVAVTTFGFSALVVGGWAWAHYGTTTVTGALLRGQSLVIEPESFDVGTIPAGEERYLAIQVFDLTARPIEIYGFGAFCGRDGCVNSDIDYPVVLAPRGSRTLPIRYSGPKDRSDAFRLVSEIYTAAGTRVVVITGKSQQSQESFEVPIAFRKDVSDE